MVADAGCVRDFPFRRPHPSLLRSSRVVNANGTAWRVLPLLAFLPTISLRFRLLSLQCLALTFRVRVAVFSHTDSSTSLQETTVAADSPRPAIAEKEHSSATGVPSLATRSKYESDQADQPRSKRHPRQVAGVRLGAKNLEGSRRGRKSSRPAFWELYQDHAARGTPAPIPTKRLFLRGRSGGRLEPPFQNPAGKPLPQLHLQAHGIRGHRGERGAG